MVSNFAPGTPSVNAASSQDRRNHLLSGGLGRIVWKLIFLVALPLGLSATPLISCTIFDSRDDNYLQRAHQAFESDRLDEATALAREEVQSGPRVRQANQLLAEIARRRAELAVEDGQFVQAYRAYLNAAEYEPLRSRRADDLLEAIDLGRFAGLADEELLPIALRALDGRPHDEELRFEIARIAEDAGDFDLAIEHYLWLYSAHPENRRAALRLGLLYKAREEYSDAISVLRSVYEADADNIHAALNLAIAYSSLRRNTEAAEIYDELVEKYPDNPSILNHYAAFEERRGNPQRAGQLRQRALDASTGIEQREMRPLQ